MWTTNNHFDGVDSKTKFMSKFQDRATRSSTANRNQPKQLRVQLSINSLNSVLKSWRCIFADHILNKLAQQTNDYGSTCCSKWVECSKNDLIEMFCVLLISSIQKRKDPSTNWFSNDPILEFFFSEKNYGRKKMS